MALIILNILVLILYFIEKRIRQRKQFFVKTNSEFHSNFFSNFGVKIYLKKNYSALYFLNLLCLTIYNVYTKNLEPFSVKNHERCFHSISFRISA